MLTQTEIQTFINHCKTKLDLSNLPQPKEYGYQNLPFCIIDAVFSIGVNYTSTSFGNTVKHFCEHFGVTRLREKELAPRSEQLSVSAFIRVKHLTRLRAKVYQC